MARGMPAAGSGSWRGGEDISSCAAPRVGGGVGRSLQKSLCLV